MHLNDAFGHKKGLHCLYNHHEQACAIAAEAYARLSGKPALVCVTSGPGGTNALTGVLGAWLDSIPMLVISGQVKRVTTIWSTDVPIRQLGDQEYHIVDVAKEMTKYAIMITEPESIAYHIEKALYLAAHGRKGPVWIDIPLDVQAAIIETDNMNHFDENECAAAQEPVYDANLSQRIFEKISKAKRPVVLAGEGVWFGGAHDEYLKLLDKLKIPAVTAWNAHDLLANDNPYYCGRPGTLGTRGGNFVVQNSDLLLVLGCRLNVRQIGYNWDMFAPNAYKIMVDIDEAELRKPSLSIDLPIHADVKDVLTDLLKREYAAMSHHEQWLDWSRKINMKYSADLPEYHIKNEPVNPYAFCTKLFDHFSEDEVVITGNGSACVISFQTAAINTGERLFTNSGCAAMGYGLPAAMGGSVLNREKRIICIDGDGSIMMNLQELQTVSTNKLNIKIFLLNNNGYHSIRQTQRNAFTPPLIGIGPESGDLGFPDFEKLAQAFGISYAKIHTLNSADEMIETVLHADGPILCEVIIDPDQNFAPKLSSKVMPDGSIVSPEIDDMFPFLNRDEYQSNKLI